MFTQEEIKMLFEALDALEKQSGKDFLMTSMFGMALLEPEQREDFLNEQKRKAEQEEFEEEILKENIILLKAKLIGLKDKAFVDDLD